MTDTAPTRRALVTGASGYIGSLLVPRLLAAGWQVRVLTRRARAIADAPWAASVQVVEGDAARLDDVARAVADIDVAYYLLHSMDGGHDFRARDLGLAEIFADAAAEAGVQRIIYLSGLHPDGELSAHLASRVEVGEVLLAAPVPAAVLQAGVVLGDGSASFDMLRHLTERLPAVVAPKWLRNRIQPIAIDDALHYLVAAADLPPEVNRTFDIGGPDVMTYAEMMSRYARVTGLGRRFIATVPVLTPWLASHWVGVVTPVSPGVAKPLVGSLIHDAVCREQDLPVLVGEPPGGGTGFDEAIRLATADLHPGAWRRTLRRTAAATGVAALLGSLATDPTGRWYRTLDKPPWQPPPAAFPAVWSLLYADIALVSAAAISDLEDAGRQRQAAGYRNAMLVNLALNAGWSAVFFRARKLPAAALWAGVLTASSADLARRAGGAGDGKRTALGVYASWCAFATALTTEVARRNPGGAPPRTATGWRSIQRSARRAIRRA